MYVLRVLFNFGGCGGGGGGGGGGSTVNFILARGKITGKSASSLQVLFISLTLISVLKM